MPIPGDNTVKLLGSCLGLFAYMDVAIKMPFVENVTEIWDSLNAGTAFFTVCLLTERPILSAGVLQTALAGKTIYTCEEVFFLYLIPQNELSITFS